MDQSSIYEIDLTSQEREALTDFTSRLRERFPERILQTVLFGSKARGDSDAWPDIDLLILVREEDWALRHAINPMAARVSLEYDVLIGPRVIGQERWERMGQQHFSLYHNIVEEGVLFNSSNSLR
jgi:predicted nucleotidyltransferase